MIAIMNHAAVAVLAAAMFYEASAQTVPAGAWTAETVLRGLDYPWDLEASAGRIVVAEKGGSIVTLEGGRITRVPLATSDPIYDEGGGGLLGMALNGDFASSGRAFFYYTYRAGSERANRVVEARLDGGAWRETAILLDGIPGHRLYNGGRVAIGSDGRLYVTTGWTEDPSLPQDLGSLAGKTLRMERDGSVPADNPFPGSLVYSFGHRNPQGIAWDGTGRMFVAEHGQSGGDEINLVRPGANYGWPLAAGGAEGEGMEKPWANSGSGTWGPSGIAFAGSRLLMASLVERALYVFDGPESDAVLVFRSDNRIRDVLPIGESIYVITTNRSPRSEGPSEDVLIRLSPEGS